MRTICFSLVVTLGSALVVVGCSGSDPSSSDPARSSTAALGGGDAGACAPTVTVGGGSCSVSVSGTACVCTDVTCIESALESCLGVTGIALPDAGSFTLPDAAGFTLPDAAGFTLPDGAIPPLPPLPFDAGSLPGIGWLPDGGSTNPACSASAIDAAKAQFCSDVDAFLAAHGSSATLDCAQVGTASFPVTAPPSLPSSPPALVCSAATHDAFAKAQASLAACNPASYLGWDCSAELQLFDGGVCSP